MERFFCRMKINKCWLDWHLVMAYNKNDAKARFKSNTLLKDREIQVTNVEPEKYCGKYKNIQ